jgi:predicted short-subunit dehydrogenase-like oxidoreductase (DUF2520 family)
MPLEKISWIGCGKVGQTLARALKDAGYEIGAVVCKSRKNAESAISFIGAGEPSPSLFSAVHSGSVHFITTNDDAIGNVVQQIDSNVPGSLVGHYFFHTSGSVKSTILEPLQKKGAEIGSIHPLQVFADPAKALETLPGIYYAIEGSERAMMLAVQMVDKLQGKLLLIPTERKALYHAAGVFAANYLTTLVGFVLEIMEEIGESSEDSYQAFLPLMVGALQNVEEFGVAGALTGPIARGDVKTIEEHLDVLEPLPPDILRAYRVFGQATVEIAVRSGKLSHEKARKILQLLE